MFVCACLYLPQGIRMVASNFGIDFKMLMRYTVPNICSCSMWEQRVRAFLSLGMLG